MDRAYCPDCETFRPLKKDGTFRIHTRYPYVRRSRAMPHRCPGSGKIPTPPAEKTYQQSYQEKTNTKRGETVCRHMANPMFCKDCK